MFRIVLSVYLMLTTLAGPWLCCCLPPRLSAWFVSFLQNDKAKPAESSHSCCQHHVPVKDSQPTNPPKAPPCPCQSNRPALALLKSDGIGQLDRNSNAQPVDLLDYDSLCVAVMPSSGLIRTACPLSSRVLTGRDILSTLHILRC